MYPKNTYSSKITWHCKNNILEAYTRFPLKKYMQVRTHSFIQAMGEDTAVVTFQTQHSYVTALNKYIEREIATIQISLFSFI